MDCRLRFVAELNSRTRAVEQLLQCRQQILFIGHWLEDTYDLHRGISDDGVVTVAISAASARVQIDAIRGIAII
jgi:hypothetical protein